MKIFSIKKQIRAESLAEAIKKESKAEITDVWIEKEQGEEVREGSPAIGFQYFDEYEY